MIPPALVGIARSREYEYARPIDELIDKKSPSRYHRLIRGYSAVVKVVTIKRARVVSWNEVR